MADEVERGRLQDILGAITGEHRTHYDVLEVSPHASPAVIRAAYRALSRHAHPDLVGADRIAEMRRLNEAYACLRDPEERAEYDRELRARGVVGGQGSWRGVRRHRTCWACRSSIDPFAPYCAECRWARCDHCRTCGCQRPAEAEEPAEAGRSGRWLARLRPGGG
jgi:molecular chaperone DnaJ